MIDSFADDIEDYYSEDPQLGDMVFLKNNFDDTTIRGEVTGINRSAAQRGLHPDGHYEVVLYSQLAIKIGGLEEWISLEEWEVTDTLRGLEFRKLPPGKVIESLTDLDDE